MLPRMSASDPNYPLQGRRQPELLAPAGNWDCARAAVANGADAIFFGLPKFNARLRADNFTDDDLSDLMDFLHAHGVRGATEVKQGGALPAAHVEHALAERQDRRLDQSTLLY